MRKERSKGAKRRSLLDYNNSYACPGKEDGIQRKAIESGVDKKGEHPFPDHTKGENGMRKKRPGM